MSVSKVALTRENIKAIADTVTGLSASRNVLGLDDIGATTDFFATIVSTGPYLQIRPAKIGKIDETSFMKGFSVECRLYFGFANDADYTYTAIEDLLYTTGTGLIDSLMTVTNWTGASLSTPQSISDIAEPEILTDKKPIVAMYTLTLEFDGL